MAFGLQLFLLEQVFILQSMFQGFLVTAERPQLGLVFTVVSGLLNILLDYLLIVVFDMGLRVIIKKYTILLGVKEWRNGYSAV